MLQIKYIMIIQKNTRKVGITLSYINTFINMICGLFLSSFLLRVLGDTEYGIYQTISSFAYYLVILEFGTGNVMIRNISQCRSGNSSIEEIQTNISTIWTITCGLAVVILTVSTVFYFTIDNIYANSLTAEQILYGKSMFVFVVAYLVISFLQQTMNGIVLAYERYAFTSLVSIIRILLRTNLLVVVVLFFEKAIYIAVIDMVLSLLLALYTSIYCKKKFRVLFSFSKFDVLIFKQSLPLCIAIFIQAIVNQANTNIDKFVIGIKLYPKDVALYSIGLYIYSMFSSLTTIPITMYAPQVISNVCKGFRGRKLTDSLVLPCRLIALIGGTILFGFIGCGKQFIHIVYGDSYVYAWYIALIIMIPMMINMSTGVIINVLDALNKRHIRSFVLLITTTANIFLTVVWIDKYGMIGAAVATFVCTLIGQVFVLNIYYQKVIGIEIMHLYYKIFKGVLLYQVVGAVIAYIIGQYIRNIIVSFVISGFVFITIEAIGYIIFGLNSQEKLLLKQIWRKVVRHDR